jgi:FixJ family two-component response regulator
MTEKTEPTIRTSQAVFIVDDDASICEGLSNLLESVGVRTEAYSSAEAILESWSESNAGCMLLDARLPGMSGVEFQEKMQQLGIGIPIIFMTAHGDIPMVRKVMKGGAVEFLTKPFQKEDLLHAIDYAFAFDRGRRQEEEVLNSINARLNSLTGREREVMERVTAGLLNKQIAAELNLSEITVKLYRRQVMDKMRAGSLAELVKLCERVKVTSRSSGDRA